MKRIIPLLLLAGLWSQTMGEEKFYYSFDQKTKFEKNPRKAWVLFASDIQDTKSAESTLEKGVKAKLKVKKLGDREALVELEGGGDAREKLKGMKDVQETLPVHETEDGLPMAYGTDICVKFKKGTSSSRIKSLISSFGLTVVSSKEFYLLRATKTADALEISNRIQESGLTEYSHPDFRAEIVHFQAPSDPFFNLQWNFHNTAQTINDNHVGTADADIDAVEAWRISKGRSQIIVAVLDQGVTNNHPDLPNTRQVRLNGSNFAGGNVNDPSPTGDDNHGNSCAGLIAATHNNGEGIAGLAPNVRIMPIRILSAGASATAAQTAAAFDLARNNGAHVISNSWGYNSDNANLHPVIVDAIVRATTLGRNGRGCVVVFAAGNTAHLAGGNAGFVCFPGNVNVAGVLTVGASDRFDRQSNYSPTNALIDLVAPSHRAYRTQVAGEDFEVWSLDMPGNPGYNPRKEDVPGEQLPAAGTNFLSYTGRFGGTSAACPQVAATAALILGLRSALTQQQVFNMIIQSVDKTGGYAYPGGRNNNMGFGRLNVHKALKTAVGYIPDLLASNPN
jgi:subtilisin family serine protease